MKTAAREIVSALLIAPQLFVIVLMAIAVSPSASALDAFGQELSVPRNVAIGTILAREYFTPQQICGQSKCPTAHLYTYPNGGASTSYLTEITTNVSGISTRLLVNGKAHATGPIRDGISQPIEIQLLSDNRPNLGGSLGGARYYNIAYAAGSTGFHIPVYLKGTVTPIDGTCSVPSQTVKLPTTVLNHLDRIGSTTGTQSFQLRINDCPKGYNRIGYTLDPVGGAIANSPGVLPLASGSTASGVKIRVENAQGAPATMGTSIKVDGYNKAEGGSFAIPMQASYIRTDAVAKAGTVKGAMTVYLDYR
ncbi:fimbrial protein [Pseudomonas sp. 22526]|uniref:fimbrial protein n=1 Tax=Pseudomonas sp. 22526 TaxID=3453937 RepID=UPI003F85F76C